MAMAIVGTFKIKRGTTAQRTAYTPELGELIVDTDLNAMFLGDGATAGGLGPYLLSPLTSALDFGGNAIEKYTERETAIASSGNAAVDLSAARLFEITASANTTIAFSNVPASGAVSATLVLKQDATGGRTWTFPASVKWPGGTKPAFSAAASAVDVVSLVTYDGGTTWYGFLAGAGMA